MSMAHLYSRACSVTMAKCERPAMKGCVFRKAGVRENCKIIIIIIKIKIIIINTIKIVVKIKNDKTKVEKIEKIEKKRTRKKKANKIERVCCNPREGVMLIFYLFEKG